MFSHFLGNLNHFSPMATWTTCRKRAQIVVDCRGHLLGRLASVLAKEKCPENAYGIFVTGTFGKMPFDFFLESQAPARSYVLEIQDLDD